MTRSHRPTVLLTGASGVLGRALIDELSADFHMVCLRHRSHVADRRVRELAGSLESPQLGLTRTAYRDLARRTDLVVHAAAATNWKVSPAQIRRTNVESTRSMLAFAERAQAPLHFVSTAFVANPPRPEGGRFASALAYIDSKIEAEQLTRDSSVPTVIIRPSVVMGDSRDGRMAAFQGLHRMAGMVARGRVPLIACDADALTDVVPQDVVAGAMGRLLRERVRQGEFWLTAGATAVTAGDIVEVALALGQRLGVNADPPRFIPAEAVDRLVVPLLEDALSADLRQMFSELLESTWLFQMPRSLPTSLVELGYSEQISRERLRVTLERSLDYWARTKGLLPGAAEPEELAS